MHKILMVEDDLVLQNNLSKLLIDNGYKILVASNVRQASNVIKTTDDIDLYLLDVTLPDGDGFTLCQQIRCYTKNPIIFLTADDEEESIIKGLDMGGDDYVTKPFRIAELLSRINALLRRSAPKQVESIIRTADLIINFDDISVEKNGTISKLRPIEHQILTCLLKADSRIVRRSFLLENIWDNHNNFVDENTLSVHICRLRDKLGIYEGEAYFETIWGIGYRWKHKVNRVNGGIL